eukprot:572008-Prorocentrum_minimum.AAC.1
MPIGVLQHALREKSVVFEPELPPFKQSAINALARVRGGARGGTNRKVVSTYRVKKRAHMAPSPALPRTAPRITAPSASIPCVSLPHIESLSLPGYPAPHRKPVVTR